MNKIISDTREALIRKLEELERQLERLCKNMDALHRRTQATSEACDHLRDILARMEKL